MFPLNLLNIDLCGKAEEIQLKMTGAIEALCASSHFEHLISMCTLSIRHDCVHTRQRDSERKQVLFLSTEYKRACVFVGLCVCV